MERNLPGEGAQQLIGRLLHLDTRHGDTVCVCVCVCEHGSGLTALSIISDSQHQAQQTLGVLPLLQQHLSIPWEAQEEPERCQGVGRDGRHGLHRGRMRRGRLRMLLVDGWRVSGDGLGGLIHQLA